MTGITTYAYLYLHGENRLQYYGRLVSKEALQKFLDATFEGALLYSDYRPPEYSILTDPGSLAGVSKGVALCPVTAGLILRHDVASERLINEDEECFYSLDGTPLNGTSTSTPAPRGVLAFEDQPLTVQNTPAFQQAFQGHPEAPAILLDADIAGMGDFYERWAALPTPIATAIASHHYTMAARQALQLVPTPEKDDLQSIAKGCLQVASAFPPWIDSWEIALAHLDVRTTNVLWVHAQQGPHALATLTPVKLVGLPGFGRKSIRNLLYALTAFRNNPEALLLHQPADPAFQDVLQGEPENAASKARFGPADALSASDILNDSCLPSTLSGIVERAVAALPSACRALGIKPHAYLDTIDLRLKGATLEACGKHFGVTRERIRQVEPGVAKWLGQHYPLILDGLKERSTINDVETETQALYHDLVALASLQIGLSRLLDEKGEESMRDWLTLLTSTPDDGAVENSKVLFMVLSVSPVMDPKRPGNFGVFSHGHSRASAPDESITLPLPDSLNADDVQSFIHETFLPTLVGLEPEVARATGLELLAKYSLHGDVADILMACTLNYWMMQDENGKTDQPYATSKAQRERQKALDLIRKAERPVHVLEDIFYVIRPSEKDRDRPEAVVNNWIQCLQDQMHSSDPDYPVLIGNSYIATINQFGLASENIGECAAYMESVMAQAPGREFSALELARALKEAGISSFEWPDAWPGYPRITTYNIAQVILINQRRPNTRNMGRFVWKHGPWSDEPDSEGRTQVTDIYKDLFRRHGLPLTAEELIASAQEVRGRGIGYEQIHEVNGIVRLKGSGRDALFWDTDLGPWPLEPDQKYKAEPTPTMNGSARNACKQLFEIRRRPITGKDLLAAATEADGGQARHIDIDKIATIDGLITLQGKKDKTLFWDTDLDPWDDEMQPEVTALQQRVIQWLQTHQDAVSVESLTRLFPEFYDLLLPLTEIEKAVLLTRHSDLEMQIGPNKRLIINHTAEREVPL